MEKRRKIKTPEEWNVKLQNMTYRSSRRRDERKLREAVF